MRAIELVGESWFLECLQAAIFGTSCLIGILDFQLNVSSSGSVVSEKWGPTIGIYFLSEAQIAPGIIYTQSLG